MAAVRITLVAALAALSLQFGPAVEAGDSVNFYQYEVQVYADYGRQLKWWPIYVTDYRDDAALAYELMVALADDDNQAYRELLLLEPDSYMLYSVHLPIRRMVKILDIRVIKTPKYLNVTSSKL